MTALTRTVTVTLILLGLPELARANCWGRPLAPPLVDPSGTNDNTVNIQNALNAALSPPNGTGAVVLSPGRYRMDGPITVPQGVVLCGTTHGPFDFDGPDPFGTPPYAAILFITDTIANKTSPFMTLNGAGAAVTDLVFHYPDQELPNAAQPDFYPFTVKMAKPGTKIERCAVTNAYQFLDIEVGRVIARALHIGAFYCGILVDHAADHVTISDIVHSVFWDIGAFASYPQNIDAWVLDNGYAFMILRADGVQIHNVLVWSRYAAFYLADSTDTTITPRMGYGSASNIDIDTCQYGIIAVASHQPGYKFTNIDIGCTNPIASTTGVSAVTYLPGGTFAPRVELIGGSIRSSWINGPFPAFPQGKLLVHHIIDYDE